MDSAVSLTYTAVIVAATHTVAGVDHYLPFVVLGHSQGWSLARSLRWTAACGLCHVMSSLVLGGVALAIGSALGGVRAFDGFRGELAGGLLLLVGGVYFLLGLRRGHTHSHGHRDGTVHIHPHSHLDAAQADHEHWTHRLQHGSLRWTVLVAFFLGPCEPLIGLMLAPGITGAPALGLGLLGLFSATTLATMLLMVAIGHFCLHRIKGAARWWRWSESFAGAAIALSGAFILAGF